MPHKRYDAVYLFVNNIVLQYYMDKFASLRFEFEPTSKYSSKSSMFQKSKNTFPRAKISLASTYMF